MKTWAYIGSNEVRRNNKDWISALFAVVANLTNLTNVPITAVKASNVAPAVEQLVTFNGAGDIPAYRAELQTVAAKHAMNFIHV